MAAPLVSVVMAVRNGGADLPRAVDSILSQSFQDFELIVVDDGSGDGTAAYLDQLSDPRVRIRHQENAGSAAAANAGIAMARGTYIARLDHDDLSKPSRLDRQVAFLQSNPEHAMCGTWAEIWEGDRATGRSHDFPADNGALQFELLFHNPFVQSSIVLRKQAIDTVGGYCTDAARQPPEDYELWSRMARRFKVANIPERLTVYREVAGSQTRTDRAAHDKAVTITAENLAHIDGHRLSVLHYAALAGLVHRALERPSVLPDLRCLEGVISRAAERIHAAEPHSDVMVRAANWNRNLRSSFRHARYRERFRQCWPIVDFVWRHSAASLRSLRSRN
jgi:glycosyltransferase involved in cell wall biosynthesis